MGIKTKVDKMQPSCEEDLGFTFDIDKNGNIEIKHNGLHATILRQSKAAKAMHRLTSGTFSEQQQLMARLTGNYKRGNERRARSHSRNK